MKTATETGYYTSISSVSTSVKNQWIKIEGTFSVPATIKKLNIRLDNNGLGNVWFDDIKIRKTGNAALANILVPDASYSDHQLNVTYNTFKSPYQIEETGKDKISFTYNDNNNRSVMFYGSLDTDKNLRPNRKHYSADGSMEIKENIQTGEVEFVTYIGGDGYSAPIVYKKNYDTVGANQDQMLYLHRDYQGSILAITNQAGAILEKRQFDAWGAIIQVQDGAGNVLNGLVILDRGYTGHEHLQSVGLINMNGRLYDPKLHRFLQPDNYVQDISNTQNYNRYGYVLNNPLKYTDPSGEKWKIGWKDIVAGLQVVAGTVMLFFPGTQVIGGILLLNGLSYFKSAYDQYKVTGDWASASKNTAIMFGGKIDTDWGYNNDKQNGVTQNEPVVKPITADDVRNMSSGVKGGDVLDKTNTASDVGAGFFGALKSSTWSENGYWLGKNGKYNSIDWGGNGSTGSRSGALKAATNYKVAGNLALAANVVVGGIKSYDGYILDGHHYGYHFQRESVSATTGIIGGWAAGWAGFEAGAAVGVWFDGVGVIPGAIGGFIFGYYGGQLGSNGGGSFIDYIHKK